MAENQTHFGNSVEFAAEKGIAIFELSKPKELHGGQSREN
jgi:hypothetical protein